MKHRDSRKRTIAYGVQSLYIIIASFSIVAVLNFLVGHNQKEFDFTKNKIHALSDQTVRVFKGLPSELQAEFYADSANRNRFEPLFENLKQTSSQFKLEIIDPGKEPARTKVAGIKKMGTLSLTYRGRNIKVEDLTEDKITHAVIKIEKENKSVVCLLMGQGEASVEDITQSGMQSLKNALIDQAYEVNEFSLSNGIPVSCSAILMMGVHGTIYKNEIKAIGDFLNQGGHAVISLDAALTPKDEISQDFKALLSAWGVKVQDGLIIDPEARKLGVDASLVLINFYNSHHPITKDFAQSSYFPLARPVDINSSLPPGFSTESIAKTNNSAWAEKDINSFIKGKTAFRSDIDLKGNLSVAVATAVKAKDPKENHETRLVVFGSSGLVNNQHARIGGNLDLFMNAVSWVLDDEGLIASRTKAADEGKVEMTASEGTQIFLYVVILMPLIATFFSLLVWRNRKKL